MIKALFGAPYEREILPEHFNVLKPEITETFSDGTIGASVVNGETCELLACNFGDMRAGAYALEVDYETASSGANEDMGAVGTVTVNADEGGVIASVLNLTPSKQIMYGFSIRLFLPCR